MSRIILYTTGCPLCAKLKAKLDAANIAYDVNTNIQEMDALGFELLPILEVNGQYLEFGSAVKWIKEQTNGN